ncbi:MAG: HAD-IB family phosphatase [Gemmatimonadaceae bacterium]
MSARGFQSVVIDVDSTLCGIEGIDWLASRCDPATGAAISALTDRAMRGEIALESVYGERLAAVRPSRRDVDELAAAYVGALAPGAAEAVRALHDAARRVVLVSGGLREAILPLAAQLAIAEHDVHAVTVRFNADGAFGGHDETSPLTTGSGKQDVVRALALPRRILAVGDGATDLAIRPAVDAFAAFTGFIRRAPVVASSDVVIDSFAQLVELVLS